MPVRTPACILARVHPAHLCNSCHHHRSPLLWGAALPHVDVARDAHRHEKNHLACMTVVMPHRHSRATTFSKREPLELSPLARLDQPCPRPRICSALGASSVICISSCTDATKRRVVSGAVRPFQVFHFLFGNARELVAPKTSLLVREHVMQSGRKQLQVCQLLPNPTSAPGDTDTRKWGIREGGRNTALRSLSCITFARFGVGLLQLAYMVVPCTTS
jgi:hypothetical protein